MLPITGRPSSIPPITEECRRCPAGSAALRPMVTRCTRKVRETRARLAVSTETRRIDPAPALARPELIGDFHNPGREYRPQGIPEEVRVRDFLIKEFGGSVPHGVYDLAAG
jgi:hypothetical protein